jgi:hypothetical protein
MAGESSVIFKTSKMEEETNTRFKMGTMLSFQLTLK